ncbi:tyrosine-type recombinase/integrase [Microbispora bryophytorum]|uniref:tyrosine-type recombinase/integrase n=1 Tax=Microbispora bryophytorum TaxID=1460882 RepID=UPI0033EF59DC
MQLIVATLRPWRCCAWAWAALALVLSAHVKAGLSGETLLTDDNGAQVGPWKLERAMRKARGKVQDLPTGFRFHDVRHYLASLLISSGADVKVVLACLRHVSARPRSTPMAICGPTLTSRPAIDAVLAARTELRQNQPETAR